MVDGVPARLPYRAVACALAVSVLLGLPLSAPAGPGSAARPTPATLGKKMFHDPSLSASGAMSCATCHDPANAHAPSNGLAVQFGGPKLDVPGFRAVPSLRYLDTTPAFSLDDEGTPNGGFDHDGRAADFNEQALRPLFAPHEMANASPSTRMKFRTIAAPGRRHASRKPSSTTSRRSSGR